MSAALLVLLEAEPRLEGYVAHVSVLQYFGGTASSMDHQYVIRQAGLS